MIKSKMKTIFELIHLLIQVVVVLEPVLVKGTSVTSGETYPMCFMNITGGEEFDDFGFLQIYAYSINDTQVRVAALTQNVDFFSTIGIGRSTRFNFTKDFDGVYFIQPDDDSQRDSTGIIPSSSEDAYFVGVKSDVGSTDAFLALPLVRSSLEFFVAAWPYQPPFVASCMIVPSLNSTCLEMYKIFPNKTYLQLASVSLNQYNTFRYFANFTPNADGSVRIGSFEDMTGYYINTTKPVQVLCGHECATVPANVPFCDHMVEQIPPVNQLGTFYVVPPIDGRSPDAGYVVRVVATQDGTMVSWNSASLTGSVNLDMGGFSEIVSSKTMEAIVVTCSKACLVMQYNKGQRAASGDVPTDPFMMLTVPSDRFTGDSGFATPNYCVSKRVRVEFDNWVTIVTFAAYKDQLLFDGQNLSNYSTKLDTSINGYAILTFRISHDFHYVTIKQPGSFACYVYGHSIIPSMSSAYGFNSNYNVTGESVSDVWIQYHEALNQYENSIKNATCTTEKQFSGEIITSSSYIPFPFILTSSFRPVSLRPDCFRYYNESLWYQLTNLTRLINYWICTTENCSSLNGEGAAINYATLSTQFLTDSEGNYDRIEVTVEMVASMDAPFETFSTCQRQIKEFMMKFINWPYATSVLFPPQLNLSNCPTFFVFSKDSFSSSNAVCSADA